MTSRSRRILLAVVAAVLVVVTGLVVAEVVLRGRADEALDRAGDAVEQRLPGATASLAGEPVLLQLLTGGVRIDVAVPATALEAVVDARLDVVDDLWFESGLLVLQSQIQLAGTATPVDIGFQISGDGDSLVAVPALVRIGGIQLPAGAVSRVLGPAAEDGFPLGGIAPDGFRVETVRVDDDLLRIRLVLEGPRS